MNELVAQSGPGMLVVSPRRDVLIRVAARSDLPFLDVMQKRHGRALGYFPTKQFEGYIEMGAVLIAHDGADPIGYVIARDRYLKRDELGVIYQLCVVPGEQRKLLGASLIKEVFERSAYGCRLYCCWCAQDLDANYFWESLGFIPIAFRAGSTGKKRVHIFWQRRITEDATPWWYPSQTSSGAIREDRLVFPIPPGTHWRDVRLPAVGVATREDEDDAKALPPGPGTAASSKRERKTASPVVVTKGVAAGGLRFAAPRPVKATTPRARAAKPKGKIDPKLIAAARELRDRYLERVNAEASRVLPAATGKYEVTRSAGAHAAPLLKAG